MPDLNRGKPRTSGEIMWRQIEEAQGRIRAMQEHDGMPEPSAEDVAASRAARPRSESSRES